MSRRISYVMMKSEIWIYKKLCKWFGGFILEFKSKEGISSVCWIGYWDL